MTSNEAARIDVALSRDRRQNNNDQTPTISPLIPFIFLNKEFLSNFLHGGFVCAEILIAKHESLEASK